MIKSQGSLVDLEVIPDQSLRCITGGGGGVGGSVSVSIRHNQTTGTTVELKAGITW